MTRITWYRNEKHVTLEKTAITNRSLNTNTAEAQMLRLGSRNTSRLWVPTTIEVLGFSLMNHKKVSDIMETTYKTQILAVHRITKCVTMSFLGETLQRLTESGRNSNFRKFYTFLAKNEKRQGKSQMKRAKIKVVINQNRKSRSDAIYNQNTHI